MPVFLLRKYEQNSLTIKVNKGASINVVLSDKVPLNVFIRNVRK